MDIIYNICFITRKRSNEVEVLMLFRQKDPNRHKWNGIGGKIEKGETIDESMEREILEETGLKVRGMSFRGIVTWNETGGMYVYRAEDEGGGLSACDEGELAWKPFQWVMEASEVVSNIKYYLKDILQDEPPQEFACTYENEQLISVKKKPLHDMAKELTFN
ncbi:NUDIX hydrolase [Peribacillus frigoritolerans]|jgi:8-oxo-dGTP diphosphatase|uniref:NUDIX hydrolase n=1 Tax=Peribacillus TaxID=2675229 RepID=UPI00119C441A|nr:MULTISPECIES: 8-oxo-dGTP diphosphatase [Peribacillus]MCZ0872604.1 8-oxo-dGTP diphosphatase [Peribacillus sp. AS_2]QNK46937.1 8-oxo-dGTP diphosphatase [Brevibacterium sp. PAMC23299]TWD98228.1 8-oxo-dGTP diphosphatase [Peribacillus frigoritolerans]WHX69151.1 8-oxo-dGTP diphosphatase [Peribacillus frigoritolerans]